MSSKHTNALIHSTSPYLLQHAHNPVNWYPWDDDLLRKDDLNSKLLLISIGYAACHWCHVMEHESFEDEEVAEVMNKNFVCIKVDREERPDVDNYYMTAVHLMGLQGGWPLNIVALPDGRPIWGGTYFPKKTWMSNLIALTRFWEENKPKAIEYAQNLQSGIEETRISLIPANVHPFDIQTIKKSVSKWTEQFDYKNGGRIGHPKFPMPVNLDFLLYYGAIKNDKRVLDFVNLTLLKMAFGGIYDQAGGGFARYSTDEKWKIPHFEKMLYDNGQLIGMFSKGYQQYKQKEFKKVVYETTLFIERELMDLGGAFYSSLDADSEGVEGKFYVWNKQELQDNLQEDFDLFSNYFNVNQKGFWEEGNYILLREMSDEDFAAINGLSTETLAEKIKIWKNLLLQERSKRIRPGLDDKTLISWNALVIIGLVDAYKALADIYFKEIALKNARFIKQMFFSEGKLFHSWKQGKSTVNGFLDDYALVIQAYVSLFEVTGDDEWLKISRILLEYTFEHFYDETNGLFFYIAKDPEPAISNHYQIEDNVIPSANSVMAHNLHRMYLLYGKPEYLEMAEKMVSHIIPNFVKYPHAFANWGSLMLKLAEDYYEVAVCGENAEESLLDMVSDYRPNILWAISSKNSTIPLLKDRYKQGKTLIYVCRKGACRLPVSDTDEALKLIGGL